MRPALAALALAACATSRPCPSTLASSALTRADYPEDTITFSASALPGATQSASVTFAVYLRPDRESPPYPAGARPIGMNVTTASRDTTPPRCDDVRLYVDGRAIASHVEDASSVAATPHDDGLALASVRFDGALDVREDSCLEIVACGESFPLPPGAGAELARLVAAR